MNRAHYVARRYEAAASVAQHGVSIFAVDDPAGSMLNQAIRRVLYTLGDERSEVWNDILQATNALRWRRMTQPQPKPFQTQNDLINYILRQAKSFRNLVNNGDLLDLIGEATAAVDETASPLEDVLLESIHEVGPKECLVVASSRAARAGLSSWLDGFGATVLVPSELNSVYKAIECSYVVAPPAFMSSSLVTAPISPEVTFIMPTWFKDRSVPPSALGAHSEGEFVVKTTVHFVGGRIEPETIILDDEQIEDNYAPLPIWGAHPSNEREPNPDEVKARKILLAGGQALWLDDGDRIRSLDPQQPEGARVGYEALPSIAPGTYLVLREGETERGAMYDQAIAALDTMAPEVIATQSRWKLRLEEKLARVGHRQAAAELKQLGVRSFEQVRAWTDPRLICPQRDEDFTLLLTWLGEFSQDTYDNAIALRRAVYRASATLRKELEVAVGRADLRVLERDGIIHLDVPRQGFRSMFVTRVLAKAPFTEIVGRHLVRVPYADKGAQWLE